MPFWLTLLRLRVHELIDRLSILRDALFQTSFEPVPPFQALAPTRFNQTRARTSDKDRSSQTHTPSPQSKLLSQYRVPKTARQASIQSPAERRPTSCCGVKPIPPTASPATSIEIHFRFLIHDHVEPVARIACGIGIRKTIAEVDRNFAVVCRRKIASRSRPPTTRSTCFQTQNHVAFTCGNKAAPRGR